MKRTIELSMLAARLADELNRLVPPGLRLHDERSTVVIESTDGQSVGGVDLGVLVADGADRDTVAYAVEKVLDTIQDFIATETGSPWPPREDAARELAVPTARWENDALIASYVWNDGQSLEVMHIPGGESAGAGGG